MSIIKTIKKYKREGSSSLDVLNDLQEAVQQLEEARARIADITNQLGSRSMRERIEQEVGRVLMPFGQKEGTSRTVVFFEVNDDRDGYNLTVEMHGVELEASTIRVIDDYMQEKYGFSEMDDHTYDTDEEGDPFTILWWYWDNGEE